MSDFILIVDDEISYRSLYRDVIESAGFKTKQAASADEAFTLVQNVEPQMIIADVRMPGGSGINLLRKIRDKHFSLPFLLITGYAHVQDAVRAMKLGAVDYLPKPVDLEELVAVIRNVLGIRSTGRQSVIPADKLNGIVLESPAMNSILNDAYRIAKSDANVLLLGESGVGKEVLTRFIHRCSARNEKPVVAVNCTAIPDTLLASELFGHDKGAFTGADRSRRGRFREADGGTLFLDEIGDMPLELQPVLLRTIETGCVVPVGCDREIMSDFRLLAATNRNLLQFVREGRFRADLYYRLNVISIEIPPLRERREDILPLARRFLSNNHSGLKKLSRAACAALCSYEWPGNIRELSNAIEHARLLSQTDIIGPEHLPPIIRETCRCIPSKELSDGTQANPVIKTLRENEIENIRQALTETGGNRTRAARLLGVTRRGLIYKLKRFGIN
jgi:DNA-binding NtrC family response regulator